MGFVDFLVRFIVAMLCIGVFAMLASFFIFGE